MKLKYYLRGLGIGILVTWLIMGISQKNAVAAARAEIMRAYAQDSLDDKPSEPSSTEETDSEPLPVRDGEPEEDKKPEMNGEDTAGENSDSEEAGLGEGNSRENDLREDSDVPAQGEESEPSQPEEPEVDSPENTSSPVSEEPSEAVVIVNPGAAALDAQTVTITISRGDDSGTVSRKLYNAGVIESASEYDAFLMQHGYDKRINPGEKVIGLSDSWQEIAEKITH